MTSGEPLTEGLSKRLWLESKGEADQALNHPFVVQLGNGSLPRPLFEAYMRQDAYFLNSFGRAYALALHKCGMPGHGADEDAFDAILQLLRGTHREVDLHTSYIKELIQSGVAKFYANPATLAYTSFLNAVADSEATVAEVLAAMVPCSRLYAYLGCSLRAQHPGLSHDYSDWLDLYSSHTYLKLPEIKEKLLDRLGAAVPYEQLSALYRRAMRLEVEFFDASLAAALDATSAPARCQAHVGGEPGAQL